MIDNFKHIKSLLKFEEGKFYFIQILIRKKDIKANMKVNRINSNSRLLKAYFVYSQEYLDFIEPEIKELCKLFNARAMIHLQKRNYENIAYHVLKQTTDNIISKNFNKVHKVYTSVCGKFGEGQKYWIIDIDKEDIETLGMQWYHDINELLYNIPPQENKIITIIPSKSGNHIITKPFNLQEFKKTYPNIDIHKNNPVNLFIP